jgi:hypothetical protein
MIGRFPLGRSIAGFVAAIMLVIGIYNLVGWWQLRSRCADAEVAELAAFQNAFGSMGTVQAEFNPKYNFTCKEMLLVEHTPADRSLDDRLATLDGLSAELVISDTSGNVILQRKLSKEQFHPFWTSEGAGSCLPAFGFTPVPAGNYQLRLTVNTPARSLINVPHRVVARYELCGIEYLAAMFMGGISLFAFIVFSIITIVIIVITRKKMRNSNQTAQPHD